MKIISIINENQGVVAVLSLVASFIAIYITIKISNATKYISNNLLDAKKLKDYMTCERFEIVLHKDNETKTAYSLKELQYYITQGYIAEKQSHMNYQMYGECLVQFIDLLKIAKCGNYTPTNHSFNKIIANLPIKQFDTLNFVDKASRRTKIKAFIKRNKLEFTEHKGEIQIILDKSQCGIRGCPSLTFSKLYRANFSGKRREEILLLLHQTSGGTLEIFSLLGICFKRKHWFSLRKQWMIFDIDSIDCDYNINPFE